MEQRSSEWYNMRMGRMTASRAFDLINTGSRPMTDEELKEFKLLNPKSQKKNTGCEGEKFYNYCLEIANERVFGIDETWDVDSWDMKRGRNLEPEALEVLKQILAKRFLKLEECSFFPYGENAGASPDGIVLGKPYCAEIKCPRPDKVFALIFSNDINDIDPVHYAQMQMQMLCTNSETCFYFVYCIFKGKPHYHLMEVPRNETMIKLIKERIILGEKEVQQSVSKLQSNKQF